MGMAMLGFFLAFFVFVFFVFIGITAHRHFKGTFLPKELENFVDNTLSTIVRQSRNSFEQTEQYDDEDLFDDFEPEEHYETELESETKKLQINDSDTIHLHEMIRQIDKLLSILDSTNLDNTKNALLTIRNSNLPKLLSQRTQISDSIKACEDVIFTEQNPSANLKNLLNDSLDDWDYFQSKKQMIDDDIAKIKTFLRHIETNVRRLVITTNEQVLINLNEKVETISDILESMKDMEQSINTDPLEKQFHQIRMDFEISRDNEVPHGDLEDTYDEEELENVHIE